MTDETVTVTLTKAQAEAIKYCLWHDQLGERKAENVPPEGRPPVDGPVDPETGEATPYMVDEAIVQGAYDAVAAAA
jgi:hypothetical protein